MDDLHQKITSFLHKYLNIPPDWLTSDGYVRPDLIGACIAYLIENKVFTNVEDFKEQLLEDYSVILPQIFYDGIQTD